MTEEIVRYLKGEDLVYSLWKHKAVINVQSVANFVEYERVQH